MVDERFLADIPEKSLRFKEADFYTPGHPVLVLGAGGIGSHVSHLLLRQDCHVTVMDFDVIEAKNGGGQLLPMGNHKGDPKVHGLVKLFLFLNDTEEVEKVGGGILTLNEKFVETSDMPANTVFSCFDNMEARKLAFEKWCAIDDPSKIFIDGRMLADQGMIYFVTPGREESYKATLFSDDEVDEGPCSNRATSFCGFFISSLMVAGLNNHLANLAHEMTLKVVPFKIRFILPLMQITIEDEPVEQTQRTDIHNVEPCES